MEQKELDNLQSVASFAKEDGGKYIAETTKSVTVLAIEELVNTYKEKSRDEIVSIIARIQANLSLYQLLSGIDSQIEAIKELLKQKEE